MAMKRSRVKKTKPKTPGVPAGFHTVTPYLTLNNAAEALEFYKKAFGAKEMARQTTPDGKILHARIKIGNSMVMMSDEFPGSPHKSPLALGSTTVTIHIYSKDLDKLWAQAVAAGAKIVMPLDNQFWGERYGQLADPFGHSWSISMPIKMTPKEMEEKTKAAMAMFTQGERAGVSQSN